jgi:hypothetical protein
MMRRGERKPGKYSDDAVVQSRARALARSVVPETG